MGSCVLFFLIPIAIGGLQPGTDGGESGDLSGPALADLFDAGIHFNGDFGINRFAVFILRLDDLSIFLVLPFGASES